MLLNPMAASAFEQKESLGLSDRRMLPHGPDKARPTGLSDRTFLLAPGTPITATAGGKGMDTARPEEAKPLEGTTPGSSVN